MNDRYFGKVVAMTDKFTIVMNKGSNHGVEVGNKYLVVGLGQSVVDSDNQEELGRLEIPRGNVSIFHVQEKISTARSCEFEKFTDVPATGGISPAGSGYANTPEQQGAVAESIKHGEMKLKELDGVQIGDLFLPL